MVKGALGPNHPLQTKLSAAVNICIDHAILVGNDGRDGKLGQSILITPIAEDRRPEKGSVSGERPH